MAELDVTFSLVTGPTSGIGRVTAEVLASRGAKVWLAARDVSKAEVVRRGIVERGGRAEVVALDLSDLESVRSCAKLVMQSAEPLQLLINNAGLAGRKGLTRQGFELTFGVNHLGHFLLTQLLLPKLLAQPSRVVNVSSKAHYQAAGIDFDELRRPGRGLGALHAYAVSKLANVLHAKGLAERYTAGGLHSYALHPGVVKSEVWRQLPQPFRYFFTRSLLSNEEGAETTLYCATSPSVANDSGLYYDECREKTPSGPAQDARLSAELWRRSEAFVS